MSVLDEAAGRPMCGICHGFGYIGDGPFTCGAKCHDCGGPGVQSTTLPDEAVEAAEQCPKCGSADPHYVTGWSGIGGSYSCEVPK